MRTISSATCCAAVGLTMLFLNPAPARPQLPGTQSQLPGTQSQLPGTQSQLPGTQPRPATPPTDSAQLVMVMFYGTCLRGPMVIYRPIVWADQHKLAQLACQMYFFIAATPGSHTFCAGGMNGKKCITAELRAGIPYYFLVGPRMVGYGVDPVSSAVAAKEFTNLAPLDSKRTYSRDLVSVDPNHAPPSHLTPQGPAQKGRKR